MMKTIYFLAFAIIIFVTFSEVESGVYSYGSRQSYQTADQNAKYYKTSQKVTASERSRNGSQPVPSQKWISAWGIIGLILGVIILSTITYYAFLLYPYICKKNTTYDIIELTEINSVCTVSDNVNNVPLRYCDSNDGSNDVSNSSALNQ